MDVLDALTGGRQVEKAVQAGRQAASGDAGRHCAGGPLAPLERTHRLESSGIMRWKLEELAMICATARPPRAMMTTMRLKIPSQRYVADSMTCGREVGGDEQ